MKGGAVVLMFIVSAMVAVMMVKAGGDTAGDCAKVDSSLIPCIPYLISSTSTISKGCCAGLENLKTITPTTDDRRAACECLKQAATKYPALDQDRASSLPEKCGVAFNIPISKTTDCTKIN